MEHAFGLAIPTTLEEVCDPKRLALVVYDTQVSVLSQIKNGEELIARILQVLQAARAAGIRVFFSRHMGLPKELMGVSQLRLAMEWQHVNSVEQVQPRLLRDTAPFQLVPELSPLPREAVFDKITMSAFEGTWLNIALRDCGINAIAIIGAAMEVGIEPTVRHAADLGYIPVIVADACGAGDEQAALRSLASIQFAGYALTTDVQTICRTFQSLPRVG